jgi:hypothetical protein
MTGPPLAIPFVLSLPSQAFPAFPPISDALQALRRLPWRRYVSAAISGILVIAAFFYVVTVRLWRNRQRIAPALRTLTVFLQALADRLSAQTEPPSRAVMISRLSAMGESPARLRKMGTVRLQALAQRSGIL